MARHQAPECDARVPVTKGHMLSDYRAECASANDDKVEVFGLDLRSAIRPPGRPVGAAQRFIQAIANVAAKNVSCEIGYARLGVGCHNLNLLSYCFDRLSVQ
jgi:hypothetical protein